MWPSMIWNQASISVTENPSKQANRPTCLSSFRSISTSYRRSSSTQCGSSNKDHGLWITAIDYVVHDRENSEQSKQCCSTLLPPIHRKHSTHDSLSFQASYDKLYARLFPAVLELSCDSDTVENSTSNWNETRTIGWNFSSPKHCSRHLWFKWYTGLQRIRTTRIQKPWPCWTHSWWERLHDPCKENLTYFNLGRDDFGKECFYSWLQWYLFERISQVDDETCRWLRSSSLLKERHIDSQASDQFLPTSEYFQTARINLSMEFHLYSLSVGRTS